MFVYWIILVAIHTGILTWNRTGIFMNIHVPGISEKQSNANQILDFQRRNLYAYPQEVKEVANKGLTGVNGPGI